MTSEIVDIFDVQIEAPEQFDVVVEQSEVNLEPLTITENGTYHPQGSATGFSKVEANVLPKSTDIVITENGEYYPDDYDVDAFSKVGVDVKPKLEELTATDNGTYTPSEGFDGFGKVNVDLRGKVKVTTFTVSNDCINEEGIWEGAEYIDTSLVTSLNGKFRSISKLKIANFNNWDTSNVVDLQLVFYYCTNLESAELSNWDTSNATNLQMMFIGCSALKMLDLKKWDVSKVGNFNRVFDACPSLTSLIGGVTIEEVLANNIGCLNGLKVSTTGSFNSVTKLDRASLRALINGLAEVKTTQTLTLGATLRAKLTEEDIAIATNKGWSIA